MELRNVNYFLTVANAGSLRAAAKTLGLTQPALTKAIRRLEDEAGVTFFERRPRGVALTTYGRSFLRHAHALRANMRDARSEIDALKQGTIGRVRIGAGPSWQGRSLQEVIRVFRADWPGVQIGIWGGLDNALKAELRAGELDLVLAALSEESDDPDLDSRALVVDDYRVVADEHHPLHCQRKPSFKQLLDYPWILPGKTTYLARRLEVMMRAHGLAPPQAAIETDLVPLKVSLMKDSDFLSFHAIEQLRALGEIRIRPLPIAEASWRRHAGIITRHDVEPSAPTHHLIEIIERVCRPSNEPVRGSRSVAPASEEEMLHAS